MIGWLTKALVLSVAVIGTLATVTWAGTFNVAVAISMREAVEDIARAYEKETGDRVELTFGSSGQLLAQIKAGAPIDAFISAADAQVKDLIEGGFANASTKRIVAGNELVLIVPAKAKQQISSFEDLAKAKRLAIGEPRTVPAGTYAMQVLKALKLAEKLEDRIVYGTNVRQVLDYVRRGEAAGIVYATDAKEAGDQVQVVAKADPSWHEPIRYPAIIVKRSTKSDAARKLLEHLRSEKAQAIFRAKGFTAPQADEGSPAGTTAK